MDKDAKYWETHRVDSLTPEEIKIYGMIDTIKNVPVVKTYTEVIDLLISGYKTFGKLDVGPPLNLYAFNNIEISVMKERARARIRKENIGFIFQNFNLIDELTVEENVELPLQYLKVPKYERRKKVAEVLERMGIAHRAQHFPKQLSGGQQQRVAVSRAVVTDPKLILADEPTGNLDSHFGTEVLELLKSLHIGGTTIIMVTHSKEDAEFSERIIQLYD